jgi:SAM-dependent methyltransferase
VKNLERASKNCILCGSSERELLIEKEPWQVYRCVSCGLGFLDPRPSRIELTKLYSPEYCQKYFVEGGKPGTPEFKKRLRLESSRIRLFRGIKKTGTVLDIGCGYGYFLAACRERGYDIHGVDVSGYAVQHATEVAGIPVTIGELNEVDLPNESYDVITMWHALEHMPDPKQAISLTKRWLQKDGLLIVDVPNHAGTDAIKTWEDWVMWSLPYHFYHFTPSTLNTLLESCGFQVVRKKDYHSETVKAFWGKFPVISLFARLIARIYSGHSIAMVAKQAKRDIGEN